MPFPKHPPRSPTPPARRCSADCSPPGHPRRGVRRARRSPSGRPSTASPDDARLLDALVAARLLTEYQAARVRSGGYTGWCSATTACSTASAPAAWASSTAASTASSARPVAIKALQPTPDQNPRTLARFFHEAARGRPLKHPNIVAAVDAGEEPAAGPDGPADPVPRDGTVPGRTWRRRPPTARCRSGSRATSPTRSPTR